MFFGWSTVGCACVTKAYRDETVAYLRRTTSFPMQGKTQASSLSMSHSLPSLSEAPPCGKSSLPSWSESPPSDSSSLRCAVPSGSGPLLSRPSIREHRARRSPPQPYETNCRWPLQPAHPHHPPLTTTPAPPSVVRLSRRPQISEH